MSDSLSKLNKEQKEAVTHVDGPLLIVAGAGTGKTTVLIERLYSLIKNGHAKPEEILITTFTEKAAKEMEARADKLLPYGYVDLWINTFHGFCERVLRDHCLDIGLPSDFKLITQTEQWMLLRKNLDRLDLDYYKPLGNPTKFIHEIIRHFSRLKDENIPAREYLEYAEKLKLDTDSTDQEQELEIKRINELANAYHVYNQQLLDESLLDFGDLICYTIKLFRERPNILNFYREKFKFVMVDEFQDTNWSQYELIKMLAAPKNLPAQAGNLAVVGDDDQCLPGDTLILTANGKKKIEQIKIGEKVATAVGKGYLSYSRVKYVSKNKKQARILSFVTEGGHKIKTTDNHKMFCFVPTKMSQGKAGRNKKYYYVYLMHKQELGWRLGMTSDLAQRLRLERSADRIVAIMSFMSEEEARYYEILLSLKYGIPTVCFQEREGIITKRIWSEKLYADLDINESVGRLAADLSIDLSAHQVCLNGVNRGSKVRIKINLEMCHRNYRSKSAKGAFLASPKVEHQLSLETSHEPTLKKLKSMGFAIEKAKKGGRIRVASANLAHLGKMAIKIQKITDGIIENKINVGTFNVQHKKALILPASNLLPGMFIPVITGKGIVYDQIIGRTEEVKNMAVYDLEIEGTHNFIANGIVVHNSIYKFRGASLSNIMQFKDDFPKAREIVLAKNYRSGQNVLDAAYRFIAHNNPNRLEIKLGINKKLEAAQTEKGAVNHLHFHTEQDETEEVVKKIVELYKKEKETEWADFAILVRANDTADKFVAELSRFGIPNQFISLRGLYFKPIVLDIIAYLKLLDNYHESGALFRVLNMEVFKISHGDIVNINKFARRKAWSMYETLKNVAAVPDIEKQSVENIDKLLGLIKKHSDLAQKEKVSKIYVSFLNDSGLSKMDHDKHSDLFDYLNQFYQRIRKFEEASPNPRLKEFMQLLELEFESGETGSLSLNLEDNDAVKIMTVHASKGLEFKYVFIPSLVDKKFPVITRTEKISIPDELVREKLPVGDIHIEEERRLFYVALTRAKKELFLTSASDYGGEREKKLSRFILETGVEIQEISGKAKKQNGLLKELKSEYKEIKNPVKYALPAKFSFSQLEAYSKCPLQYKFNFILKIPVEDKVSLIFGRAIHNTLRDFLSPLLGNTTKQSLPNKDFVYPTREKLLELYEQNWQDDGYETKKERDLFKAKGKKIMDEFYTDIEHNGWPDTMFLEKSFNIKIGGHTLKGTIDRMDRLNGNEIEIIDYKTGTPKEKVEADQKRQLILYKIVAEEVFGLKAAKLSFYYLEGGNKVSFEAKEKEVEKVKEQIIAQVEAIKKCDFSPTPNQFTCKYCDFKGICEFRKG